MYQKTAYPAHLSDETRILIAEQLIQKETRKLLPELDELVWQQIDDSIMSWRDRPQEFKLEHDGLREFWDIFASLLESVKLKPNFTAWMTAKNVAWRRQNISVQDIQLTSASHKLRGVPGLDNLRDDLPISELNDVLSRQSDEVWQERKAIVDSFSTDEIQNRYPIITYRTDDGFFKTLDGNRRSLLAFFHNRSTIDAWVATKTRDELKDYWLPVNDMLQLAKIYQSNLGSGSDELTGSIAKVLRHHFESTIVARLAFEQRILPYSGEMQQLYNQAIN